LKYLIKYLRVSTESKQKWQTSRSAILHSQLNKYLSYIFYPDPTFLQLVYKNATSLILSVELPPPFPE
jgi:hypothetical protein